MIDLHPVQFGFFNDTFGIGLREAFRYVVIDLNVLKVTKWTGLNWSSGWLLSSVGFFLGRGWLMKSKSGNTVQQYCSSLDGLEESSLLTSARIPSCTSSLTLCPPLNGVLDLSKSICCTELAKSFHLYGVVTFSFFSFFFF